MLAHQLVGREALALRDVETPRPGQGEVLVRVRAAGVCETDVRLYHVGGEPFGLPRTLGHEFSGEVAEVEWPFPSAADRASTVHLAWWVDSPPRFGRFRAMEPRIGD